MLLGEYSVEQDWHFYYNWMSICVSGSIMHCGTLHDTCHNGKWLFSVFQFPCSIRAALFLSSPQKITGSPTLTSFFHSRFLLLTLFPISHLSFVPLLLRLISQIFLSLALCCLFKKKSFCSALSFSLSLSLYLSGPPDFTSSFLSAQLLWDCP